MIRSRFSSLVLTFVIICSLCFITQIKAGITIQEGSTLKPADSTSQFNLKEKPAEEKFNPGEMIMEHVVDNHEWHIATIGHLDLTIPLPVLIICQKEFHAFWSGKFNNETTILILVLRFQKKGCEIKER
jgi:hypothetical protein